MNIPLLLGAWIRGRHNTLRGDGDVATLYLVISELADNLAGSVAGAPCRTDAAAAAAPVQVGAALGGASLGGRRAARPQARRAGGSAGFQHAVLGLGGAPVHRLKKDKRVFSMNSAKVI